MIWYDIDQNTDAWLDLRCGKVGGSSISKVMANYPKAFGNPAHDLAIQIAIEQITGKRQESTYINEHMQRGHEQEPIARAMYEQEFFCEVSNGGYFDSEDIMGVSPDGLVDDDGAIEIKSVLQSVHFANVQRGKYDPSYKWQLFAELLVSGRDWIDFVSFCATFPEGKRLFVDRVYRSELTVQFGMITKRIEEFKLLVEEKKQVILG